MKDLLLTLLVVAALTSIGLKNFLLFHVIAEFSFVVVGCVVFVLGWTTRELSRNIMYQLFGVGYLVAAAVGLVHTLAYPGMNVFAGGGTNLACQLWLIARFIEVTSFGLALGVGVFGKIIPPAKVLWGYAAFATISMYLAFRRMLPVAFVEGLGLTPAKIIGEYVLIALLLVCILVVQKCNTSLGGRGRKLMTLALFATVLSEFCFTLFPEPGDVISVFGHILKVISVGFIYEALILETLCKPCRTLFHNLESSRAALAESERHYRRLFRHISEGFIYGRVIHDNQGNVKDVVIENINPKFEAMFGINKNRIIGRRFSEIRKTAFERWMAIVDKVVKTGKSEKLHEFPVPEFGVFVDVIVFCPSKDRVAALIIDTTKSLLEKEKELSLRQELIDSMREQRHDILNELTLTSTYIQLNRREEALRVVQFIAAHLSDQYNVPALPSDAWFTFVRNKKAEAEKVKIQFSMDICPSIPNNAAERRLLPKLVVNLIDNAIDAAKGHPDACIEVAWKWKGSNRVLTVRNSGDPIPEGMIQRIFQPGFSSKGENRGWGLAICRKIAQELHGQLYVRHDGRMTEFGLVLPRLEGSTQSSEIVADDVRIAT